MEIFKLFGSIFVDSSKADESIAKTGQNAESLANKMGNGLVKGAKAAGVAVAAAGAAVGALGTAMFAQAKKTAEYGDKIDKNSQKMGISSKKYQEWEHVLQHSGTSMDNMGKTFQNLSKMTVNASDAQIEAFEKIGLSYEDVQKMSTEELWEATINGLQGMEEGAERSAIATKLLGNSAKELGPLLNTSAEDTQAMIDAANDLGIVMSDDAVKNSAAFQDAMQDFTTSLGGLANKIGAAVMPMLTDLLNWITSHMPEIQEFVTKAIDKFKEYWDTVLKPNLTQLYEFLRDTVAPIVVAAFKAISDFWNDTLQPALKNLYEFIRDTVAPIVVEAFKTISDFWDETLQPALEAFWKFVVETLAPKVTSGIDTIKSSFGEFMTKCENVWSTVKSVFDNIYDKVVGVVDTVIEKIAAAKAALEQFWADATQAPSTNPYDYQNHPVDSNGNYLYAKAYDEPYLLDTETVFGRSGNKLLIGGDRGSYNGGELVYGHDALMQDIANASGAGYLAEVVERGFDMIMQYMPACAEPKVLYNTDDVVNSTASAMRTRIMELDEIGAW